MKHIFGPVPSRRLGLSLGIDTIPFKTCSLDCVYCECGKTTNKTAKRKNFVSTEEIIIELKEFLSKKEKLDYITFSGSGEPTLNSEIGNMIKEIKKITNISVAVLTNGTLLDRKDVREDLMDADLVIPSLDAVTDSVFKRINRPAEELDINQIIKGLIQFRKEFKGLIWLEILFVKNINDSDDEIDKIIKIVKDIKPDRVQLNTVDRPPAEIWAKAVDIDRMKQIKKKFSDAGIVVDMITRLDNKFSSKDKKSEEFETEIIELLKRRPETAEGLSTAMQIHINHINKIMRSMEEASKVEKVQINDKIFYKLK